MKIPYGRSNFADIRRRGFFYVDKTPFLPVLESDESGYAYLVFLRPRRMGKSLLLSMMEHYYDKSRAAEFDALFGGLWVHAHPTPEKNQHLVLSIDFSSVATDQGPDVLRRSFFETVKGSIRTLLRRYQDQIPSLKEAFTRIDAYEEPSPLLSLLFEIVASVDEKLYVLIDEYDSFANRLLADGNVALHESIARGGGFVRSFYATLKAGTTRGVVWRMFVTGVSPILLDEMASGFNIASHVSTEPRLNALVGFTRPDVERAVDEILLAHPHLTRIPELSNRDEMLAVLESYYNGYRFSERARERVFNSDMVLYFLKQIESKGSFPDEMLDMNVRMDYRRLQQIGMLSGTAGPARRAVLETIVADGRIDSYLVEQFGTGALSSRDQFVSLLYYLGMLTLGTRPEDSDVPRFEIPNRVIRQLSWEHLAQMLQEQENVTVEAAELQPVLRAMAFDGDILPFIALFQERVVKAMGLKDLRRLDERSLKLALMAFLSLSKMFRILSEKELAQGFCDLFLGASPHVPAARYAWLLELKYVPTGASAEAIESAFTQAAKQIERYASDDNLVPLLVGHRTLKAGTLLFVGAQDIQFRPWSRLSPFTPSPSSSSPSS